jgi:hypothetical protein
MTPVQARKVPTIKMYYQAAEFFPGSILWEYVHKTISENNLTSEKIRAAAIAWQGRGFNRQNVEGILEWAVKGIPQNGKSSGYSATSAPAPAINTNAVEQTRQYNEDRWNFKPAPPPVNLTKPVLKRPEERRARR